MDIATIDNKIQEYIEKLNVKTLRKVKKCKPYQKVGIPFHLRKFYKEEISKLEKQKEGLLKQKKVTTVVEWKDVIFDDFYVRFFANKLMTKPYQCPSSRKSLEFLKPYILKRNLSPIKISVVGNQIVSIENLEQLDTIINILTIQDIIRKAISELSLNSVYEVFNRIKKISNKNIFDFFKIKDKSKFLEYLCDIQDNEYKIIPVTEIMLSNDSVTFEEDTFLFTFTRENIEYIVWESTSLNRATYIFRTNETEYDKNIQFIFEYIIAERNRKRSDLKSSINTINNQLNCIGTINHGEFESWKIKFNNIVQFV